MPSAVSALLTLLDLDQLESTLFQGHSPKERWQRVFGGQVVAQALAAACRTVTERLPHSLHAYFLLPGDPKISIDYQVDPLRDGRSFSTRRVLALQNGQAIFSMSASFHGEEEGFDHAAVMPDVPSPEDLPSESDLRQGAMPLMPDPIRAYYEHERPIELRPVEYQRYLTREPLPPRFHVWLKANGSLPEDQNVHRAVLAYASDMTLLDSALLPHGRTIFEPDILPASLDHAVWFHRPFRADDWLLYAQDSPSASGARGFSRGLIFQRDGTLIASVAQEGLIRVRK